MNASEGISYTERIIIKKVYKLPFVVEIRSSSDKRQHLAVIKRRENGVTIFSTRWYRRKIDCVRTMRIFCESVGMNFQY